MQRKKYEEKNSGVNSELIQRTDRAPERTKRIERGRFDFE